MYVLNSLSVSFLHLVLQLSSALADPGAVYTGKKRIARAVPNKPVAPPVRSAWGVGGEGTRKGTKIVREDSCGLPRPKLPLAIGGKVPTKLRQKFLDSFIDEILRSGKTHKLAYKQVR